MPAVETKIWLALKSRIDTLPLDLPKAWPAETFNIPVAGGLPAPYIRIGHMSVDPIPVLMSSGARHNRTGSLMLTLVHPLRQGYTMTHYEQMAGQIAEHFADGLGMRYQDVCVEVNSAPHVNPGYEDSGYWTVPVRIPWRTYA